LGLTIQLAPIGRDHDSPQIPDSPAGIRVGEGLSRLIATSEGIDPAVGIDDLDRPLVAKHKDAGDLAGPDQDLAGRFGGNLDFALSI
jgi:hypothetical protein